MTDKQILIACYYFQTIYPINKALTQPIYFIAEPVESRTCLLAAIVMAVDDKKSRRQQSLSDSSILAVCPAEPRLHFSSVISGSLMGR